MSKNRRIRIYFSTPETIDLYPCLGTLSCRYFILRKLDVTTTKETSTTNQKPAEKVNWKVVGCLIVAIVVMIVSSILTSGSK